MLRAAHVFSQRSMDTDSSEGCLYKDIWCNHNLQLTTLPTSTFMCHFQSCVVCRHKSHITWPSFWMHHAAGSKNLASLSCYSCFVGAQTSEGKAIIWGNSKRRPRRTVWSSHCLGAMPAQVTKTNLSPAMWWSWLALSEFFFFSPTRKAGLSY